MFEITFKKSSASTYTDLILLLRFSTTVSYNVNNISNYWYWNYFINVINVCIKILNITTYYENQQYNIAVTRE